VIACYDYLEPWFNLLLIGLVLTVVSLLGVILFMALKWPREPDAPTTGMRPGVAWTKETAEPRREDRPTGSPDSPGKIERYG
jgi:hypothetical protein